MIISQDLGEAHILAIDPGNDKTGIALLTKEGALVARDIIKTLDFDSALGSLLDTYPSLRHIVCGNGTNHRKLYPQVEALAKRYQVPCHLVDEAHTTEEAKVLYWSLNPPKGLRRLLPKGVLVPPEPVDDITAYVIGKRWVDNQ